MINPALTEELLRYSVRAWNAAQVGEWTANLRGADLRGADLRGANLSEANPRGADLSGAYWGVPIPTVPHLDAAILDAIGEDPTRLNMRNWHTCETTHCRAGWAVTLAGDAGRALEAKTSPYLAGRLIYEASRPGVPCPNFFASDDDALADITRCASV